MVIQIKNFIDSDPAILLDKIEKNLEKNKKIVLDFSNMENITHEFLEGTLGKVLEKHNFEAIQFKINFINVDAGIKEIITRIVKDFLTTRVPD
jgi:hypothetical protein